MKPFDPRLIQQVPQARRPVALLGLLGTIAGALAIASAFAIAALVVALVDDRDLVTPTIVVVAVFAARGLIAYLNERAAAWAATRISGQLRGRYLTQTLDAPADERPDPATVFTTASDGSTSVEPYVSRYLPTLITAAVVPPLALVALFFVDWTSGLIVLLTLPLLPLFAALIGQHTQDATQRRWKTQTRLAGHFLDVMRGLPTLVSYGRAEHQADQVGAVGDKHRLATVRTLRIAFLSSAALELLATISVAIVAVWTGMRLAWGELDLGIALTAILLAPEAYWPIRRVGQEFHSAADGVEAIDSLLVAPTTTRPIDESAGAIRRWAGNISYTYPESDQAVLQEISMDLQPGVTVIAGPSGSGKTTLLELLAGLRTPTAGEVGNVRAHLVTQSPFIAPMSVRDNLTLGAGSGSLDAAMLATGFRKVIDALPAGLETQLGDDGFGLSAGQRARLALTRAWLSDTDAVLLDEPTAHLDPVAAQDVRAAIAQLARHRPVVVVSHDDALIAQADHTVRIPALAGAR